MKYMVNVHQDREHSQSLLSQYDDVYIDFPTFEGHKDRTVPASETIIVLI